MSSVASSVVVGCLTHPTVLMMEDRFGVFVTRWLYFLYQVPPDGIGGSGNIIVAHMPMAVLYLSRRNLVYN